jgi:hypothetical protein
MPKKQERPAGKKEYDPIPFKGFINYALTDEEKARLKAAGVDHDRLWDSMEGLLESNWSAKFRYDYYNHAYQVTLSCNDSKSPDAGWFLTGRGSTPMKALRQALYIGQAINWQLAYFGEGQSKAISEIDD